VLKSPVEEGVNESIEQLNSEQDGVESEITTFQGDR
jgi:hypothetical protein